MIKEEKGITLMALAITILVMLILVIVTVNIMTNGGFLTHAHRAARTTDTEIKREQIETALVGALDNTGILTVDNVNIQLKKNFGIEDKDIQTTDGKFPLIVTYKDEQFIIEQNGEVIAKDSLKEQQEEIVTSKSLVFTIKLRTSQINQELYLPFTPTNSVANPVLEYDFTIDYGDGSKQENVKSINTENMLKHTFIPNDNNQYIITVTGKCESLDAKAGYNVNSNHEITDIDIIDIESWGEIGLKIIDTDIRDDQYLVDLPAPTKDSFKNLVTASFGNVRSTPKDLFKGCTNLISVGSIGYQKYVGTLEGMFDGCTSLRDISNLFYLSKITSIPADFAKDCQITNMSNTFEDCTLLDGNAPEFWKASYWTNTSTVPIGTYCFDSCTGLDNYDSIPSNWKQHLK